MKQKGYSYAQAHAVANAEIPLISAQKQSIETTIAQKPALPQSCELPQYDGPKDANCSLPGTPLSPELTSGGITAPEPLPTSFEFPAEPISSLDILTKDSKSNRTLPEKAGNTKNAIDAVCGAKKSYDKIDKSDSGRYQGPKYSNMNEVFKNEEFGKRLQQNVGKIKGVKYQGQQCYKVTRDMKDIGIKEGDKLYLDGLHKDHIEVFKEGSRSGTDPRQVVSVDGRSLPEKLAKAIEEGRKCPF